MSARANLAVAVTSSTGVMSVAVGPVGIGGPFAAATIETDRRHAEEISPLIKRLVDEADVALGDLDVLVVDRGPGRFTGLRVGLATVRMLAFALGVPVIGLTSLQTLANLPIVANHESFGSGGEAVTAVIDARRNEVFQQTFKAGHPVGDAVVGLAADLGPKAQGIIVGDGLDRFPDDYGPERGFVPLLGVTVDAVTMLQIAELDDAVAGTAVDPLYLRTPDVNPNVKTRPRA